MKMTYEETIRSGPDWHKIQQSVKWVVYALLIVNHCAWRLLGNIVALVISVGRAGLDRRIRRNRDESQ